MDYIRDKVDYYLKDTPIENIFINEYMIHAKGDYVKVYLFASMYADQDDAMSNETIAKYLNLEIEDVLAAWTYWEKQGVIRKHYKSPKNKLDYVVEFISLKQLFLKGGIKAGTIAGLNSPLTPNDLKNSMENEEIKKMYSMIERVTGRPFEGNELLDILSWIEDYKMEPEVITQAYSYCVNKKNNNKFRYVSGTIKNWRDHNVKTVADLEKLLEETDKRYYLYKRVLRALGLHFRYPTEEEKRIMDNWFDVLNYNIDTVLEACKKTSGISNPNINYINSILKGWSTGSNSSPYNKKTAESDQNSKGSQIKELIKSYEKTREKNSQILENRKKEIYSKIPRIKEIENEIVNTSLQISKLMLSGSPNIAGTINSFRKKIDTLNQEKAYLLTESNFSMHYLDAIYECTLCKDTGMLENGERCECFNEKLKTLGEM